jgi:hypothetical protein
MSKYIIVVEELDWFLTEKSMAVSLFIDVHIHFCLFDFLAFKTLANSYLWLKDHKFFSQVNNIFHSRASLSPAETSELMIANQNSSNRAIKSVIMALETDGDRRVSRKIRSRLGNNATPNTHTFLKIIKKEIKFSFIIIIIFFEFLIEK